MSTFAERRKARIDSEYTELRAASPELFRECVQSAEGLVLNHDLRLGLTNDQRVALAADIEQHLVSIALRALAAGGARCSSASLQTPTSSTAPVPIPATRTSTTSSALPGLSPRSSAATAPCSATSRPRRADPMAATKSACCCTTPHTCTATPTWGLHDGGNDPYRVNYACDDHLGHVMDYVMDCEAREATVWPLIDGHDPRLYSAEDIQAARHAAKKEG